MKNLSVYIGVLTAMIVWSSSFIFTKVGLASFPPVMLVTMRMSIAALLLFIVGKLMHSHCNIKSRRDFFLFLGTAFVQPFAYFVCEAYSLSLGVGETAASIVMSTIPLFTPFLAFVIIREKISIFNFIGLIVSLGGVVMILLNRGNDLEFTWLGIVCLLGSVLAGVVYPLFLKKVPDSYSNVSIIFYNYLFSLLFYIPLFLVLDVFREDSVVGDIDFSSMAVMKSFGSVVLLASFASVLAFIFFCKAVRELGASKANAFCNIMPATTALVMLIFFGELLSWVTWVGIFVVIVGLFISQKKRKES